MKKFFVGIFMFFTLIVCAKPKTDDQKLYVFAEVYMEVLNSEFGEVDIPKTEKEKYIDLYYKEFVSDYQNYKKDNKKATVKDYIYDNYTKEINGDHIDKKTRTLYFKLLKEKGLD